MSGSAPPEPDLTDEASQHLVDIKRRYLLYDTGKLVNIFLQQDGRVLHHFEHPNLLHIGGMSHYLSPPDGGGGAEQAGWRPDSETWPWPVTRLEVALFTAAVVRSLADSHPAPELPADVDPALAPRLAMVRDELITLVTSYRDTVGAD